MSPTNEAQTGNLAPVEDKNAYDGSITWGICFRCDRLRHRETFRGDFVASESNPVATQKATRYNPVAFKHLVFR